MIEGILAAKEAGFDPVKINAVAIKGTTEDDVVPLGRFAREHGLELRFIEYMPLDAGDLWERGKVLFAVGDPRPTGAKASARSPPRPTRTREPRRLDYRLRSTAAAASA